MIKRFRMIAGPNGSGKSTLASWLARDYAVNFYTMLNADEVFATVRRTHAFFSPFPIETSALEAYVGHSGYAECEKSRFLSGEIMVDADCIRFLTDEAVNSYTVALLVNFLQDEFINRGISFSQETVFSHHSKIQALAKAKEAGFRTYLYFVCADDAGINTARVSERYAQGGHNVPAEKIVSRYSRSLENMSMAIPYLSRAFFFDNSRAEMLYLACYSEEGGFQYQVPECELPKWLKAALK